MSLVVQVMQHMHQSARADQRDAVGRGGDKLKRLSQRRDMNRKNIEEAGERAGQLEEELAEVNDRNLFLKGVDFVFGQDPAGAVNEKQMENQAGVEKSQAELETMRTEQKSIFRELERSDRNMSTTSQETKQMLEKRDRIVRDHEL